MARVRAALPRNEVPFLHEKAIEAEALLLLKEYAASCTWQISAPVPIEDIIELHLGLAFGIEDLRTLLNMDDVLGAIWFNEKAIRVDTTLDPSSNPSLLGRYRFTLAHEAAHWRLHRQYYQENPNQRKLFDGRGQPAIVCRSSQKPPAEWQADFFAGCMLMPRDAIRSEWQVWRGSLDPVALQQLPAVTIDADSREHSNATLEKFCRPFADRFEVSAEAMRIRLERLGFLLRELSDTMF